MLFHLENTEQTLSVIVSHIHCFAMEYFMHVQNDGQAIVQA